MNDRDFKLLVREYFQAKSSLNHAPVDDWQRCRDLTKAIREKERQILSELEEFTKRDVEELPFDDKPGAFNHDFGE